MATVVVLTALELEYRAVRDRLAHVRVQRHRAGTWFEVGDLADGTGEIAVAITGKGNPGAAVLAERAIAMFGPRALLFVGVGGALNEDIGLGDVVVATKVYGYHGGAEGDDGFGARPEAWQAPHELEQIARHVARAGTWATQVHFKPVAAGEVVLNSRETPLARQLRRNYNDAVAVEMESAGVSQAGHLNRSLPVLTVRGISDKADGATYADDTGWQAVAAERAVKFGLAVAAEVLGQEPKPDAAGARVRRRTGRIWFAAALVAVLVVAGTWLYLNVLSIPVTREPGGTTGDQPFMASVGTDRAGVTAPSDTGGAFAGNQPGLYGGTRSESSCDPGKMVQFLQQHPDKAVAWAGVAGIRPEQIPEFVSRLTPAVLRSDTYVTNHGFGDGKATPVPAVLQAGTAVLVDRRGLPVAKCFCGNPLSPPVENRIRRYTGPSWPGFSAGGVTVVRAAKAEITTFTMVDPKTNTAFDRPAGTTGPQDRDAVLPPAPGAAVITGKWKNEHAVMIVEEDAGQLVFHWVVVATPQNLGVGTGFRQEACTVPAAKVGVGQVQLACTNDGSGSYGIGLDVSDSDHVTVRDDPQNFFMLLGGPYVRCPSSDACRTG
ncbi:5'-methylthioadenosine/S-adenosylhomocysteine nucleosidase [Lentzea sp. NPDC004782]|uniref:5'-methylthioadenosine/S-adenosylhomocysteine nucleosidase n=1 Tax=Lentzea sp. NPDC004782 TaxID=3154458 RepID=UPI0033B29C30